MMLSTVFSAAMRLTSSTFDIDGIVGKAEIDSENKTVDVTVEPMDISSVEPDVKVSEGAMVTTETLVDGQAVTFDVTAENGTIVSWEVTAKVQHGISFTYKSDSKVVLTAGVIDSTDPDTNELVGDGVPYGYRYESGYYSYIYAMKKENEYNESWKHYARLYFIGSDTVDLNEFSAQLYYYRDGALYLTNYYYYLPFNLSITKYGKVGGSIQGIFSGTVRTYDGTYKFHELSDGFFKVRRLENY